MTPPEHAAQPEPARAELAVLRQSTDRLLAAVSGATGEAPEVRAPSLLPGWTRGHVLTHLARNADALRNVVSGRPMYTGVEARDADIEAGAPRPLPEQVEDVRVSAERLAALLADVPAERWRQRVELRNGVTDLLLNIPFRRRVEVELHLVDLGIGPTSDDLPEDFADRAIGYLADRFAGRPEVSPAEVRTADGRIWRTGRRAEAAAGPDRPVLVTGTPGALVGWLSGRAPGADLGTDGGALPVLPAL